MCVCVCEREREREEGRELSGHWLPVWTRKGDNKAIKQCGATFGNMLESVEYKIKQP